MPKVLRKIRHTNSWSIPAADWTPAPGVPSACLADLGDAASSPSFYVLSEDLAAVTVAAALATGGGGSVRAAQLAVFDDAVFDAFPRDPMRTLGATLVEAVNGAHVELARANASEILPFLTQMHEDVALSGSEGNAMTSGLLVITKQEILDELHRLVATGEIDDARLDSGLRRQLGLTEDSS